MFKKATVITSGCPENRIDCARIEQLLVQNGWETITNFEESDLIIFNACGLTKDAELNAHNIINKIKKKKKKTAQLIVGGCLPKIDPEITPREFNGDIIVSDEIKEFVNIFNSNKDANNIKANYLIPTTVCSRSIIQRISELPNLLSLPLIKAFYYRKKYRWLWDSLDIVQPNTFYIKISSGCSSSCSFCAIRHSRGTIKSKSIEQVMREFFGGLKLGYKQFALLATDAGSYGCDIQTDLVNLLREMISVEGNFRIKLRNVHPGAMIRMLPDLLDVFKSGKVVYMTTSAEHGNDRILNLMNRGYKIEDFKFAIAALRNACPELKIQTQLMVGFPGETDLEFFDTMKLIDEIRFDFVEVYKYSPRKNTLAAEMPNQVSMRTAYKRYFMLRNKFLDHLRSI